MEKIDILSEPYALPEGLDLNEYIIGTYLAIYPAGLNLYNLSAALAIEQSTGTWLPVPGETKEVKQKHLAKVINFWEVPHYEYALEPNVNLRSYVIQIAFPIINFDNNLPLTLSAAIGNITMAGPIKILDVTFPKKYCDNFSGPKFGIDGIRKILNVYDRPLINNMIKPCTGYPVEVGEKLFYEAALGGADMVKDDELIADVSFNRLLERVKAYMRAEKRVYEETGEHTLYCANITDELPKIFETAKKAVEVGANCLMVDFFCVGLPVLRALAEDKSINVPILAHPALTGAAFESPRHGIASHVVLGKLPRLCGADIVVYPAPYGKAPFLKERFLHIAKCLSYPMHNIKATFPMASGGITPSIVPQIIDDLGIDCVIGTGGAIHAHPKGSVAGAKAFRQAIDATLKGIKLSEAAKEYEELALALSAWKSPFEYKREF